MEGKYYICFLILIIATSIYSSVTVSHYHAAAKTLDRLEIESNLIGHNVPSFNVGEKPVSIAVDESDNLIYVANEDSNTVSVINGDTMMVSNVTVGENPWNIALDLSDNLIYVANPDSDTVSVINGDTMRVSNVTVGDNPVRIAVGLDNLVYVANSGSDTVSVINGSDSNFSNIATVSVGVSPQSMAVDDLYSLVYVANAISDTVSVINGSDSNFSNIATVSVGESPQSIAVDRSDNLIYVANQDSDNVSVINGSDSNFSNIATVSVGEGPWDVAVDESSNLVYVTNLGSNTVSVINGSDSNFSNIANVTVGESPQSMAVDPSDNLAYVANYDSNTVSVIYGASQKTQVGVSFDVNPFHAGYIKCNTIEAPTNQYFYVDLHARCEAQANRGFQSSSWIENLGGNSTRTISSSQGDRFTNILSAFSGNPSPATVDVNKFGKFTANFEKLPPAIPPEYLATLFTVVVTAFVGSWLTPSFIGWRKAKKQGDRLDFYHEEVEGLYKDTRLSENDKQKRLNEINNKVEYAYAKGKISEQQYNLLKKKMESFVHPNENKTSANKLQDADDANTTKRSPI